MEDIGKTIEKLRIGHDGTGFGAGWHLDKVEVRRLDASGKVCPSYCDLLLSRHLHSDIGNFSWQVFDPQYFAVSHAISCFLLSL